MHRGPSSRDVFPLGRTSALGQEVADQIETVELFANACSQLLPGEQHDPAGRVQHHQSSARCERSTLA